MFLEKNVFIRMWWTQDGCGCLYRHTEWSEGKEGTEDLLYGLCKRHRWLNVLLVWRSSSTTCFNHKDIIWQLLQRSESRKHSCDCPCDYKWSQLTANICGLFFFHLLPTDIESERWYTTKKLKGWRERPAGVTDELLTWLKRVNPKAEH